MKQFYIFLLLLLQFMPQLGISQNMALASENCYKFGIKKSGIYKIDASFLKKYQVDINTINPKNIKIFGNGGGMLPQANATLRPLGLIENSIFISGENDDKFDNTDYLLFYGQGPNLTYYDSTLKSFNHKIHLYSDSSFYFLCFSNSPGNRIKNNENIQNGLPITIYDDYYFHETDLKNINIVAKETGRSGREWFGEEFNENSGYTKAFNLKIPEILPKSEVKITTKIINQTLKESTNYTVLFNNTKVDSINIRGLSDYQYATKGIENVAERKFIYNYTNIENTITIICLKDTSKTKKGILDYFSLQSQHELALYGDQTQFRSLASKLNNTSKFILKSNVVNPTVWDLSKPNTPSNQIFEKDNQNLVFGSNTRNELKEFIIFNDKNHLIPDSFSKTPNQNLFDIEVPNLLIITTSIFEKAAKRLADFRNQHDKLDVQVVTVDKVYNEFSSGKCDVSAIRDFAKYLYNKAPEKLKYILLFADANYDIRNVEKDNDVKLKNLVPTYQSRESLDPIRSYASDDYFGFLEDKEGNWLENDDNKSNHTLDVGVGRIPVKTVAEAEGMVDKLIAYENKSITSGKWKTKVAFAADDGDGNLHQIDSEDLSTLLKKTDTNYSYDKIFVDAFERLPEGPQNILSPGASQKIKKTFQDGVLIFNYVGHGGISNLSDEKILLSNDLYKWQNLKNLPLMVTATCQFGRYDNPGELCGGEMALLNPNGGAIALLTTTRSVYSLSNKKINEAFYKTVFEKQNGQTLRLGDVIKTTKNNSFEYVYNRNFTLLGDPSMKLAYPDYQIKLSKINGKSPNNDTLKAFNKVILQGEITNAQNGSFVSDFNGKVNVTIFDKENTLNTLGNNVNSKMGYKIYNDKLFEGEVTVEKGVFNVNFIIPADINYKYGFGRLEMYALSHNKEKDASGVNTKIIVGGSGNITNNDKEGPKIGAFLNNSNFVDGQNMPKNIIMFAKITDESGINISSGAIGHEIKLKLDNNKEFILNDNFITELDNPNIGNVNFELSNLSIGKHTIEITAWDIYNNSSTKSLSFVVTESDISILKNVKNFPNPVQKGTTFSFEHELDSEDLEIKITIFDNLGKLQNQIEYKVNDRRPQVNIPYIDEKWDLNFNLKNGIYSYLITVDAKNSGKIATGVGKLIVID